MLSAPEDCSNFLRVPLVLRSGLELEFMSVSAFPGGQQLEIRGCALNTGKAELQLRGKVISQGFPAEWPHTRCLCLGAAAQSPPELLWLTVGSGNLDSKHFPRCKVCTDRKNQNSDVLSLDPVLLFWNACRSWLPESKFFKVNHFLCNDSFWEKSPFKHSMTLVKERGPAIKDFGTVRSISQSECPRHAHCHLLNISCVSCFHSDSF